MRKQIIVRSKPVLSAFSNFVFFNKKGFKDRDDFINYYGIDNILKNVFEENESFETLSKKYEEYKNNIGNNYFLTVTKLDEGYGIVITQDTAHIYFLHLEDPICLPEKPLVDWYYCNDKMYMGDAWWSSDEEIIEDAATMPLVPFFKKYKGF